MITTSLTRAAANNHKIVQTEVTKNVRTLASPKLSVLTNNTVSLSRCLSSPFGEMPKLGLPYIPNLSLLPSFLAFDFVFYFAEKMEFTGQEQSSFSSPSLSNIAESLPALPSSMGKGAFFPAQLTHSTCALALIFLCCLRDLGLACIFNLSLSTEFFTSSYKRELFSLIFM